MERKRLHQQSFWTAERAPTALQFQEGATNTSTHQHSFWTAERAPTALQFQEGSHQHKHPHHCCQENGGREHPPNTTHLSIPTSNLSDNTTATVPDTGLSVPLHLLLLLLSLSIPIRTKCIEFDHGFVLKGLGVVLGFDLMGNCWCGCNPSIYRVSSNVKSESPKNHSPSLREGVSPTKLPSNPEEVEDLRRDTGVNPLIAFTFNELKVVTGNFRQENLLGGGGFGSVYKGFIGEDLKKEGLERLQIAVKVHDGANSFQGHREWLAEVIFLGQLSHPNLVKLIGYCCEDDHRVLIYEYMARGSVENNLFSRILIPLPWSIRMKIALGAAKGLAFLHEAEKPIIYRDFKTSNILLDMDYNAKLSDFGLAKDGPVGDKSHVSTRIMGTLGYAAPEYMMTGHLTARSDVYSFGVVLLELLTGRKSLDKSRPAREQNLADWALPLLGEKKKLLNIIDARLEGDYPIKGVHKAAMLAYHCLNHNPKARPLMRDIVDSLEPLQIAPDSPTAAPITVRTETPVQEAQREAASCN